MSTAQTWDPASYARNARFVSDLGSPVVDLLAPKPGERILDLGCGDGVLTKKLADLGCEVVAVDSSVPQIEAARKLGLNASVISGEDLPYTEEFDAVFSNAVLHWIRRADVMLAGVYRSLKPGGRLLLNAEATVAFTRSGLLWFKHWTAVGLMARLASLGISPHLATTPPGWNAQGFASIALR